MGQISLQPEPGMSEPVGDDPRAAAVRALIAGDAALALQLARLARATVGDTLEVLYCEAAALIACGDPEGETALQNLRTSHAVIAMKAVEIDIPRLLEDSTYAHGVGASLYNGKVMGPAALALGRAAANPASAAHAGLLQAQALHAEGRIEDALQVFLARYFAAPSPALHSFILYCLVFLPDGTRRHAEAARNWARDWADPHTPSRPIHAVERHGDRPLRVGYVAPSFTRNQTRQFVTPVFEGHAPEAVELFTYVDDAGLELEAIGAAKLRSLGGLDAEAAADLVREDRIDILVDVWGHAAGHRLDLFARKPAPVQVSWLNYTQTTGLRAMDYVLHGDFMDAPGKADLFSETVLETLGPVTGLFRPHPAARTSPAPALRTGYVTFASFNHPAKLSPESLAAWAAILRRAPTARLVFRYAAFADPGLQAQIQTRFLAAGVDPDRLSFAGHATGRDYEAAYAEIDVALDPSPCPGGTTTLEAFSRGVPVLTLDSDDYYARIGVQPMMALGLPQLVARNWDDYVERACALAADPEGLACLRAEIRPRFDASPYRQEHQFVRRLEAVYRGLFDRWLTESAAQEAG